MTTFAQTGNRYFKKLDLFVPVVAKVHGGTHPEFHEVRRLYEAIRKKSEIAGTHRPDLDQEFRSLRAVTGNYTVPEDVCESYEAVYHMLAEIDTACQN